MRRALFLLLSGLFVGCKGSSDAPASQPADGGPTESGVESCYEAPLVDGSLVAPATAPLIKYVNPFVGTGGVGFGVGSTFPGPQRPYGMARPGPDTLGAAGNATTFEHCAGYSYGDPTISGFSQTRMNGAGIVDYGTIGVMPTIGLSAEKTATKTRRTAFDKKSEKASPGFYGVTLDGGIGVEITATEHVAYHRWTFPKGSDANVVVDVGHALPDVTITDGDVAIDATKKEVTGHTVFKGGYSGHFGGMAVYFVARFDRAFGKSGTWKAGVIGDATAQTGGDVGAWASFDASTESTVTAPIGISFVDVEHARKNLDAEATVDFDSVRKAAEDAWEKELSRVIVEGRARDLNIFYTALYHSLLMPTLASDVDGTYRGLDQMVHTVPAGERQYTDFSLWDTYRTLHPWLAFAYPEHQLDFVRSMVRMQQDLGADPKWPLGVGETGGMVGDSAAVVFADSYMRGVRDFDAKAALAALKKNATVEQPNGRGHVKEYVDKGWIAIESGGASSATTLEYSFDDAAVATLADALGEKADADAFKNRAANWKNLWDAQSGFLLGRHTDGSFTRDDDMTGWQPYWAEGDTWQYTWFVPHDVPGLAEVMGGREKFFSRLDEFFALSTCQPKTRLAPKPYYWHSNEMVLFVPWAYAELDDAQKSAQWVRWALANEYGDGPDGIPGNDDGGTMSAWYLFSSLGIFPRVGTNEYLLGAPLFRKATIKMKGGDLVITAEGAPQAATPKSFAFGGSKLSRPRIAHEQLVMGGNLTIEVGP
ncbi:MAG: GH92 family glycosyl hydrolase [Polyangiales bacterium]